METKKPMEELTPAKLARPMDRNAMQNDMGILKNLLGLLNNPAVTGAAVPVEEPTPTPIPSEVQMASNPAPAPPPPPPPPKPVVPAATTTFKLPGALRIFFTGATKAGKSWVAAQLGARIMEMGDPIEAMIQDVFPDAREESRQPLREEIYAWGCGLVNKAYPLTASRMNFVGQIRMMSNQQGTFGVDLQEFGTAGFWIESLIARVAAFHQDAPTQLVAVTDVNSVAQYQALRGAGFAAFHVICSNITRNSRGGHNVPDPLATTIERDITQKLSQQPRGPKLWAIWSDDKYPPTSSRLLTVQEFIQGVTQ